MKIQVNLATRPYIELASYFKRLRIVMVSLAVLAIAVLIGTHILQGRLSTAQAQMDDLQARTDVARNEKLNNERRMRQPQNAAILDRAHFLNGLFLRKSFSWTAVMMDLENVLPTGVQVTSIEPQISAEGDVVIRLRVAGDRDRAVLLVRNLERSKRFREPRLTGESVQAKQPGQNATPGAAGTPGGVEFEILARYNPLPAGEAYPKTKLASTEAAPRAPRPTVAATPYNAKRDGVVLKPYRPGQPPARLSQNGGPR